MSTDLLPLRESTVNVMAKAASEYIGAGFCPIPVLPRSKNPGRDGWQNLRVALTDVPALFLPDANIGLLLGKAGNDLVDFDLDCPEAVALAPAFLPLTHFKSGRPGNSFSHYWYKGNPVPVHRSFEFAGEKLVELRNGRTNRSSPKLARGNRRAIGLA
jgi:bifunctional DNA primase/polymerase-like protein